MMLAPMSGILDPEEAHVAALRRLADFAGARVVEVGCGDGRLTLGIAERAASVLAFDPDDDAVARARAALPARLLDRVSYRVASATEIEIPRSAYDIVVFSWSLCCIAPEDVVHVLRRCQEALVPDGLVLDLQVIPPDPRIETDGQVFTVADGSPLFVGADAARAAVDLLIAEGLLVEEAVDDHDVLKHYESGAALVEDWAPKERKLPAEAVPLLQTIDRECVVRERCRLRRLRRVEPTR
jgi:SAM-dependent methyltransferase